MQLPEGHLAHDQDNDLSPISKAPSMAYCSPLSTSRGSAEVLWRHLHRLDQQYTLKVSMKGTVSLVFSVDRFTSALDTRTTRTLDLNTRAFLCLQSYSPARRVS
jgi:hypothetical protein